MDFLRHQPVSALEVSFDGKPGFRTNSEELDIVPVVDGDFIPEPIEELRRKVPRKVWMIGVTEYEALLFGQQLHFILFGALNLIQSLHDITSSCCTNRVHLLLCGCFSNHLAVHACTYSSIHLQN